MMLKENNSFKLPSLTAGSFSGLDRLDIPHSILILKEVNQRDDNGDIEIVSKAKDGPEQRRGRVRFLGENQAKKDGLAQWLQKQVGNDIETIYQTEYEERS